jgi:hypothetical protein
MSNQNRQTYEEEDGTDAQWEVGFGQRPDAARQADANEHQPTHDIVRPTKSLHERRRHRQAFVNRRHPFLMYHPAARSPSVFNHYNDDND